MNYEVYCRTNPVIFVVPVFDQGVNKAATGKGELRIKSWKLCIVISAKTVNNMWALFNMYEPEHGWVDWPVVLVDESTEICLFIVGPRDPLGFEYNAIYPTKLKYVHGNGLNWALVLPIETILGTFWLSVKTLVFQLVDGR